MGTRRVSIVEVGASHVACGRFLIANGRLSLESCAAQPLAVDSSYASDCAQSVAEAVGRLGVSGEKGALIVPGHLVLTKLVRLPVDTTGFSAADHIPLPLDEVIWERRDLADRGVFLVAARRTALESLCRAVEGAGFEIQQVVPAGVTLPVLLHSCHAAGEALLVSIGARSTSVVLGRGEQSLVRTIQCGGNTVTRAIATDLEIEFGRAEKLKCEVSGGTSGLPADSALRAAVRCASRAFAERLGGEVRPTLAHWQHGLEPRSPVQAYLTGGGADLAGLADDLAEELGVPVARFDLRCRIEPDAARGIENVSAEMTGLAAGLLLQRVTFVQLLSPPIRRAIAARRREPVLLGTALLLVAAGCLALLHVRRGALAAASEAARAEAEARVLHAEQAKRADLLRQLSAVKQRADTLRSVGEARTGWAEFLGELQAGLAATEGAWLDRLEVVPPTGTEANPGRRLGLSGRLLELRAPGANASRAFERASSLLTRLRGLRFVAAIENQRFEPAANGLLRFEVTLVLNPEARL
jgi:Tfp pilus assembly PilM family ATPase/Tfp pilus assembly protein PilN